MSKFAKEVQAAFPDRRIPVQFCDTWAEFYAAVKDRSPREMWVHHNADGSEKWTPETAPEHYEEAYWKGDTVGVVAGSTASIFTRVAPDMLWLRLRIGPRPTTTLLRQVWWDLGIRKLTMRMKDQKLISLITAREKHLNNTVTFNNEFVTITLTKRPTLEFFRYDNSPG